MSATRSRVPEFPAGLEWFNVSSPVRMADQTGRVVLIDFGTFSSIHCQQALGELRVLGRKYGNDLVTIGVHSPRFTAEMRRSHVKNMLNKFGINYPVIHDPDLTFWKIFGIKVWPTRVLVDTEGYILGALAGAGKASQLDRIIQYQAGRAHTNQSDRPAFYPAEQRREMLGMLSYPGRVVVADNRLYIADCGNNRILAVSHSGQILHQYGSDTAGFIDGNGCAAAFNNPQGMTLADDILYVADTGNHAIRQIDIRSGEVSTLAGTGSVGKPVAGRSDQPHSVSLNSPHDLVFRSGKIYIAMAGSHQLWRLSLIAGTIEVFSGSGTEGLQDGPSGLACFSQPTGLTSLGGWLYAVDAGTSSVRMVNIDTGSVRTIVGQGLFDFGDRDGRGRTARLQYPLDIKVDTDRQTLWLADTYNNKIKKINIESQVVSSIVIRHRLDDPGGLAFHRDTLYIANTNANEILKLNPDNGTVAVLNVTEELAEV